MRLLLDENLPEKIRLTFPVEYEVVTVRYMGWSGMQNGALMALVAAHLFDGFVTMDKNLPYQQNIEKFPAKIFILDAPDNKIPTLIPYIERLCVSLASASEEKIVYIYL